MSTGLDKALKGVLEGLRDAATALAMSEGLVRPPRPELVFLTLVVSVALISSSSSPAPAVAGIAGSLVPLAYLLSNDAERKRATLTPIVYVLASSMVISAPLIVMGRHGEAELLILRVVASTIVVVSVARLIGWRGLALGMRRLGVPGEFAESMHLVLYYVPLLAAETIRLISARKARSLRRQRLRKEWRLLSSTIGELVVRSMHRALVLSMAVEARSLARYSVYFSRPGEGALRGLLAYAPQAAVIIAAGLGVFVGN
ncbi:energy-coupling factor transporter transmembrane component T family protein [Hyperthermus butylicus]|uniref:Cobalt transport protein n=1 Tax=Hyperthermus butylicus (strain DSM 5456 / JCM 9403 / PLM1-5) TaxID=415426 RepID=A2BJF1_HYPBU|nr:energy-coupling factor transporter transmembrane component T [Hyperthermus butylicus]ABM80112.1 putative cobalt transport protein [Hyperthermus butylicus DSM 5456]